MNIGPSQYQTAKSETYSVVLDWIQATQEFHCYHVQINEILKERACTHYAGSSTPKSHHVSRLDKLRKHMNDVLETLLVDMNSSPEVAHFNLSKAGRLITHARLLKDINKKISRELVQLKAL